MEQTDTFTPTGEVVIFVREKFFYPLQLSGLKPTIEECNDHARRNPGTLRIEDMHGNVLWPEGTQH